jgi:hypothetical protein
MEKVEQGVALAASLAEMRGAVSKNLEQSLALDRVMEARRARFHPPASDPFVGVIKVETPLPVVVQTVVPPPPPPPPEVLLALQVRGVLLAGGKSMAVVNNQVYGVGDVLGGLRIVEITGEKVVLASSLGRLREVRLEGWDQREKPK